jgi:hypothetical protein
LHRPVAQPALSQISGEIKDRRNHLQTAVRKPLPPQLDLPEFLEVCVDLS